MTFRTRNAMLMATLAIGGLAIPMASAQDASSDRGTTAPPPAMDDPATVPPANGTARAPDAEGIRDTLALATEQAVSKNGFDNLVNRFVDADRNRIKTDQITQAEWDKLNGRIDQIRKAWKARYNQDFDIEKEELVFNDRYTIIEGEIGDVQPARARTGDNPGMGSAPGKDPREPDTTPGPESNRVGGGDANREPGRNVAKVTVPASHGMPMLFVPMIHELPDSWKIDVPDTVDGRRLYDNLLNHLTMIGEMSGDWPADVNDAYRAVNHHVLIAVMDLDRAGRTGDLPARDTTGTGQGNR